MTERSFIHAVFGGVGRLSYSLSDFLSYGNHKKRQSKPRHWLLEGGGTHFSPCKSSKLCSQRSEKLFFGDTRHGRARWMCHTRSCSYRASVHTPGDTRTGQIRTSQKSTTCTGCTPMFMRQTKGQKMVYSPNKGIDAQWPWNMVYQPL